MTIDKAFETLDPEEFEFLHDWNDLKEAAVIARKAIKKQVPVKMVQFNNKDEYMCPICGFWYHLNGETEQKYKYFGYCVACGQAIRFNAERNESTVLEGRI